MVKIYKNGAWKDISLAREYQNGAWQDAKSIKVYKDGAWQEVYPTAIKVPVSVYSNLSNTREGEYINYYVSPNGSLVVTWDNDRSDNDWENIIIRLTNNFQAVSRVEWDITKGYYTDDIDLYLTLGDGTYQSYYSSNGTFSYSLGIEKITLTTTTSLFYEESYGEIILIPRQGYTFSVQ